MGINNFLASTDSSPHQCSQVYLHLRMSKAKVRDNIQATKSSPARLLAEEYQVLTRSINRVALLAFLHQINY